MSKYKYLLFDADNTLYDFDAAEYCALKDTFLEYDVLLSDEEQHIYHEINDNLWKMLERGETTREELKIKRFADFSEFMNRSGIPDPETIAKCYVDHLSKQCHLINGAVDVCRELSKTYHLYLITNGLSVVQRSRIALSPISEYFSDVFISEEIGYAKPAKEFFEHVFESIGDSDKSLYLVIGDSLSSDIQGAVNFQCDSAWISADGKSDDRPTYTINDLSGIYDIL